MHYVRVARTGDAGPAGPINPHRGLPAFDRFMAKVDVRGPDECWPWTGARDDQGYGLFKVARRMHQAPRWLLARTLGRELAEDEVTRHTCDNPPCCNGRHLLAGTPRDNSQDAQDRGRLTRGDRHWTRATPERLHGERNPAARLTAEQVATIRDLYASGARQIDLAADYGISQPLVSQIIRRKVWAHI